MTQPTSAADNAERSGDLPSRPGMSFEERTPGPITRLLWQAAGADEEILRCCPQGDWSKYQGIGGAVVSTTVLAFLTSSYAFYTIFSPRLGTALSEEQSGWYWLPFVGAIFAGMVWSAVIFNLDRFMVSSMHGDGTEDITLKEFKMAVPRLVIGVLIGVTLSVPLELKVMESEILSELEHEQAGDLKRKMVEKTEEHAGEFEILSSKIEDVRNLSVGLAADLETRRIEVKNQRLRVEEEAEGSSLTGRSGRGPAWLDKKENLAREESEFAQFEKTANAKQAAWEEEVSALKVEQSKAQAAYSVEIESAKAQARNHDGIMIRLKIAHELYPVGSAILTLLLIVIEIAPLFSKMMLNFGSYEYMAEGRKRLAAMHDGVEIGSLTLHSPNLGSVEIEAIKDAAYYLFDSARETERKRIEMAQRLNQKILSSYEARMTSLIDESPELFYKIDEEERRRAALAEAAERTKAEQALADARRRAREVMAEREEVARIEAERLAAATRRGAERYGTWGTGFGNEARSGGSSPDVGSDARGAGDGDAAAGDQTSSSADEVFRRRAGADSHGGPSSFGEEATSAATPSTPPRQAAADAEEPRVESPAAPGGGGSSAAGGDEAVSPPPAEPASQVGASSPTNGERPTPEGQAQAEARAADASTGSTGEGDCADSQGAEHDGGVGAV